LEIGETTLITIASFVFVSWIVFTLLTYVFVVLPEEKQDRILQEKQDRILQRTFDLSSDQSEDE
jgi:hypothetical protein